MQAAAPSEPWSADGFRDIILKSYWKYFLYVIDHKINVLVECWKEGLYFQGIVHNLSKFKPQRVFPLCT
ncbi:MAG: DUF5662 family protein [Bacillota bacterium]